MQESVDVIAMDGPSASGKSTVARRVAAELGALYVDSGALYRGVTWHALEKDVAPEDTTAVAALLAELEIEFFVEAGAVLFRIGGVAPGAALRSAPVRENVSPMAAIPRVRSFVTERLRGLARFGPLVMEGRDIGSVVFPTAKLKFFLDASPEERARRRQRDLAGQREARAVGEVREALAARDRRDSSRATAPLKVADGAEVIDSTSLGIDEVVARILEAARGTS